MEFIDWFPGENYLYREISLNCTVEIGISPVLFGYRVIAGFYNDTGVQLNWCAGDSQEQVITLFRAMKSILCARAEPEKNMEYSLFRDLPRVSNIKPYFNDPEFCDWLFKTIAVLPVQDIIQKDLQLHQLRRQYHRRVQWETAWSSAYDPETEKVKPFGPAPPPPEYYL